MLKTSVIMISGRGTDVEFAIDDTAPFETVTQELREHLVENKALYSNGTITVNVGRRLLLQEQLSKLMRILKQESGLTVDRFWVTPDTLAAALSNDFAWQTVMSPHTVQVDIPEINWTYDDGTNQAKSRPDEEQTDARSAHCRGTDALLIKTTCRSGEIIRHKGDIVVIADVNPGAELISEGDISVFGSLRGLAHAGAAGNIQATVIALNIDTPRLMIGPYTGVTSNTDRPQKSKETGPIIAYVRRHSIYVAPFVGRFAGNGKGTLYGE
jgi:septum site-determining protein MinC